MSFVDMNLEEPRQSVPAKSEQLANAYSKELTLRTALSSHKLSSYWGCLQKQKPAAGTKKAISFAGLKSFPGCSAQIM